MYCLHREQWDNRGRGFNVEHFTPTAVYPAGKCDYSNLLYACAACNEAKQAILGLPNPCEVAFHACLQIMPDGHVAALNTDGQRLLLVLRLDSEKNVRNRSRWMRNLEVLRRKHPGLYNEYMGFPEDLPDLRTKKVPSNSKPEGAMNCHFALRERGELPAIY